MTPDDPRHGTNRGYHAHRRAGQTACDPCKRGAASFQARYDLLHSRGVRLLTPALGIQRRLQALHALGWSWRELDRELGMNNMVEKWGNGNTTHTFPATRATVAALYDRLSMRFPPERNAREKGAATKARRKAQREGWPPPLAWENIDDPAEQPDRLETVAASRSERFADLLDEGAGFYEVLRNLGLSENALEKWCDRNGHREVFNTLARAAWEREGRYCRACERPMRPNEDHWCGMTREQVRRGAA